MVGRSLEMPSIPANGLRDRALLLVVAAAAVAGFGLVLWFQPYSPEWAALAGMVLAAAAFAHPGAGVAIGLALLPVADLTDRTAILHATESDLVLCAVVSGAALRQALMPWRADDPMRTASGFTAMAFSLLALSYALSSARLLTPWPGLGAGSFAGYSAPMTGLRLVKGFLLACGLLVVVRSGLRARAADTAAAVRLGVVASLTLVSLHVLWERLTFVGLTDLATDYRATGPFWEMHIGGAQLDGWIALTLPMAAWWLLRSRRLATSAVLAAVVVLTLYAVLVSFSRGLFGAVALEGALLTLLALRQGRAAGAGASSAPRAWLRPLVAGVLGAALLVYASLNMFATSGYRGLAALLGLAILAYAAAPRLAGLSKRVTVGGAVLGLIGGGVAWAVADLVPKGPYLAYVLAAAVSAGLLWLHWRRPEPQFAGLAAGGIVMTAACVVLVAVHWGGPAAGPAAGTGAVLGLALLPLCRIVPGGLWRGDGSRLLAAVAVIGLAGVVTAAANSYFAQVRIANTPGDVESRQTHWSDDISLPRSPADWLLGLGPGSFREAYFWRAPPRFMPGRVIWTARDGTPHLNLSGPVRLVGWGEMFRISQRVDADVPTPVTARFRVRGAGMPEGWRLPLHLEICRKHLIYNEQCVVGLAVVTAAAEDYVVKFGNAGELGSPQALGMPRPTRFAFGLDSIGGHLDILSMQVDDANGRPLLRNANFTDGMQWWFLSSDRYHLPFHAKDLWLHFLVEQGLLGVAAITLLLLLTGLWLAVGPGARHPLAAPLLVGLTGFVVVGIADSLLDSARLVTLSVFVAGFALALRPGGVSESE